MSVNDTYSPGYLVRSMHSILHLDSSLHPVSNEFNITFDSQFNDYSKSLIPVPVICMALGIIAVVCLQFSLCARLCCKVCKCLPAALPSHRHTEQTVHKAYNPRFNFLLYSFIALAILTIVLDQALLFGNKYLSDGVNTSRDAVDYLFDLTTGLNDEGQSLLTYGNQLANDFTAAEASGCDAAAALTTYVDDYYGYVNDYLDYVSPLPGQCSDASDGIDQWGVTYKNQSIWVFYVVLMLGVILYSIGMFFKSKLTLQISIGISELIMIVLFLAVGVEMLILIGFADFCMDPIPNTLNLIPRDVYNVTSYYATCQGVNPLQSTIDIAQGYVDDIQTGIEATMNFGGASCQDNPYLLDALTIVTSIDSVINTVVADIGCAPTQYQVQQVLESGLCQDSYQGIYTIWLTQYVTAALLMLTTIIISMIYQYFGRYWSDINAVPVSSSINHQHDLQNVVQEEDSNPNPNEFYYSTSSIHDRNNFT